MSPEPWEISEWIESTAVPAWQRDALAASWVPPEEAEALRTEAARVVDLEHGNKVQNDRGNREQARAEAAEARVRELESSWVPPERVKTIDCPTFRWVRITERGETRYEAHECPVCYGSGKLQILLSAE